MRRFPVLAATILAALTLAGPASAQTTTLDRAAIEKIVREYLVKNPDVIVEAIEEYQRREAAQKGDRARLALTERKKDLLADSMTPVGGNPKGDITVVEFFDYNCGYCKRAHPTLKAVLAADPNVRVIYKEFPILTEESRIAARIALAAARQGKYMEMHAALMEIRGAMSRDRMMEAAREIKLDMDRLVKDMDHADVVANLAATADLARAVGVEGTPAFVIGDQLIPGAVDAKTMKAAIAKARKG